MTIIDCIFCMHCIYKKMDLSEYSFRHHVKSLLKWVILTTYKYNRIHRNSQLLL